MSEAVKYAIVTTTINEPTKALHRYAAFVSEDDGAKLYIIGDKKTPHDAYLQLARDYKNVLYYTPEDQESLYPELSEIIGWNSIQRRNLGFIEAYRDGAEYIATVDDDNIPLDNWLYTLLEGRFVGNFVDLAIYPGADGVFNPLERFDLGYSIKHRGGTERLWHRGLPEDRRSVPSIDPSSVMSIEQRKVLVLASLWEGDPDVSALGRMVFDPLIMDYGDKMSPYAGTYMGPFNSQNTILHRSLFPTYFLFPGIGRMDDIYASYVVQAKFGLCVAYGEPTVNQMRNEHDVLKDFDNEKLGFRHTREFIEWCKTTPDPTDTSAFPEFMPEQSRRAYDVYKKYFEATK